MARVKRAVNAHKKRRKALKLAKGYFGAKSKRLSCGDTEQVRRSLRYAYIGRKLRKRDFRKLWIARINAGVRAYDMSYSRFINGLEGRGCLEMRSTARLCPMHWPSRIPPLSKQLG